MNRILITGANGQLGSEINTLSSSYPSYKFFFTDMSELDITKKEDIQLFVSTNKINTIINCAAYTAVDNAESEHELANKLNHLAVQYLAEVAKLNQCKLIHISTDYVFDGTAHKPYVETDLPNPKSIYGTTKLDGELALQNIKPVNSIIIRTSWLYSSYGNNFLKTMLRLGNEKNELGVIFDQIGTPTYAGDLAKVILDILEKIENREVEIFHYSNEGVCSWYDFAKEIFEHTNTSCLVSPICTEQYPTAAKRPYYSVFNKNKIKNEFKNEIPFWRDSLKKCLLKI